MKNKLILVLLVNLFVVSSIAGCQPSSTDSHDAQWPSKILPLRDTLPILDAEAKKWHDDAQMIAVSIEIDPESIFIISAKYTSPTVNYEGIIIYKSNKEYMETEIIKREYPKTDLPIIESDWILDSQQAYDILMDLVPNKIIKKAEERCSSLDLDRKNRHTDSTVFWILTISNCDDVTQYYYIDAKTGEFVQDPE